MLNKEPTKILAAIFLIFMFVSSAYSQRVKWMESFDDRNPVSKGWKFVNSDGGATDIELSPAVELYNVGLIAPRIGHYFFKLGFESANRFSVIDDWIITPKLYNISQGDTISFWCGAVDRTFKDSLKVWISDTDNDPSSFIMIDYFKVDGPVGSWHKKSYDLSAYSGKSIYFAVNYFIKDAGAFGNASDVIWIDEFTLSGSGYGGTLPIAYRLYQNFPNPFNSFTMITFDLPRKSNVNLKIYDPLGKEVYRLVNTEYSEGTFSVRFDAKNLASGIYFYRLNTDSFSDEKKMVLIK
jgi:hypothetical protein